MKDDHIKQIYRELQELMEHWEDCGIPLQVAIACSLRWVLTGVVMQAPTAEDFLSQMDETCKHISNLYEAEKKQEEGNER